jgi:hypothetical protein
MKRRAPIDKTMALYELVIALTRENGQLRKRKLRRPSTIAGSAQWRILQGDHTGKQEAAFLRAWQDEQSKQTPLLESLLTIDPRLPAIACDRDYEVAATVMQWLGTPVGQSWLARVVAGAEFSNLRTEVNNLVAAAALRHEFEKEDR